MALRRVQYLVVDSALEDWKDQAPAAFGHFDSKELLEQLVRAVAGEGEYLVHYQGLFVLLRTLPELPPQENDPVKVKVVRPLQPAGASSNAELLSRFKAFEEKAEPFFQAVSDKVSSTRPASKINDADLNTLKSAMRVVVIPREGDPTPSELLSGEEPPQGSETWWDVDISEPKQRDEYAERIRVGLSLSSNRNLALVEVTGQLFSSGGIANMPFKVSCKTDEILTTRRFHGAPSLGGLMGFELKKKMRWSGLRQAEAEWLLISRDSMYPYCQVITDLETGAVAYYLTGKTTNGFSHVERRIFLSLSDFWDWAKDLLLHLPSNIGCDDERTGGLFVPSSLEHPKRLKLSQDLDGSAAGVSSAAVSEGVHAAMKSFLISYSNAHDVAQLADLRGFPEIDVNPPSYFV